MSRFYAPTFLQAFFLLSIWTICSLGAAAQPVLVKDINTTPASIYAYQFCNCGSFFYFNAEIESAGTELWKSDGTTQGTVQVKALPLAFQAGQLTCFNGSLLFSGGNEDTGGYELWKTDGTAKGTMLLKEIIAGPTSGVLGRFVEYNGKLFFFGRDPSNNAPVLWSTDGSAGGTTMVLPLGTDDGTIDYQGLYSHGFYFILSKNGSDELWRSDGTPGGTVMIKSSSGISGARGIQDKIYVSESQSLMVSNGTAGNYTQVRTFSSSPQNFHAFEDKLLFDAQGMVYVSDGTPAGTVKLADGSIEAGTVYQDKYFGIGGSQFFSTDGTPSGTHTLFSVGSGGYPAGIIPVLNNRMVIFSYDNVNGYEPRLTDGTAGGTTLLKDIAPGEAGSDPSVFTTIGDKVFFLANDGVHGQEIWQTDGTTAGTSLLKDVEGTKSASYNKAALATLPNTDAVFFSVFGKSGQVELWQSDGAEGGTKLNYNFSVSAFMLGTMGDDDLIFFDDKKLVKSNGKPNGTSVFKDLSADIGSQSSLGFSNSTTLNGKFIFYFYTSSELLNLGGELWVTDGTSQGTSILKDIQPGSGSGTPNLNGSILGNSLIFGANDGITGLELWTTDGTTAGTKQFLDLRSGPDGSGAYSFATFNNAVYFGADDGINGTALWKTDGTAEGTQMIKTISSTGNPTPSLLTDAGDYLIFSAWDEANGWAVWRSDGTTGGTYMLKDINPSRDKNPILEKYVFLNNRVYFPGNDGVHGKELWITDGTAEGTFLIDLVPGLLSSDPRYFIAADNVVYFSAGWQLWKNDGTLENTMVVSEIAPINQMILKNDWIYFIGRSDDYGAELFKLKPDSEFPAPPDDDVPTDPDDGVTSIAEFEAFAVTLYPNPASNTLQIASTANEPVSVSLMDLRGTVLSSFVLEADATGTYDVSQYTTGLYLVRIGSKRGTAVRKFIKK